MDKQRKINVCESFELEHLCVCVYVCVCSLMSPTDANEMLSYMYWHNVD